MPRLAIFHARSDGGSGALIITEWGSGDATALPGFIHAFFDDTTTSAQNAAFFAYYQPKPAYYAFQRP